jgi:hypothetical protein
MKKLLLIFLFLCAAIMNAQKPHAKTAKERLEAAFAALKKSKDTTAMLIMQVKHLATQKIVYRTKLVQRTDTVWRIDTCITVMRPIDSATIAMYFRPRDTPRVTRVGRIIRYIFHNHKKTEK